MSVDNMVKAAVTIFSLFAGLALGWFFNQPSYPNYKHTAAIVRMQEHLGRPNLACPDGSSRCNPNSVQ